MACQPKLNHASDTNEICTGLVDDLRAAVGRRHVITDPDAARAYTTGYRIGSGSVLAVVRPATLVELWRVAHLCVEADTVLIVQAANTGLTGGSTPCGGYDRPVVLISTLRIDAVLPVADGTEALCLAGATLTTLEERLAPFGRVPHSVIGSSCLGASVVGGICNNSGGALVSRGPAFTRHALFARVDEDGRLVLVNNLGMDLGSDPETILANLDSGTITPQPIAPRTEAKRGSTYESHVRNLEAATPARYNADSRCHFEASGSAGKVIVFAVRVESYPAPERTVTFLLATDDPDDLAQFRTAVLGTFRHLPVSAEYLHRDAAALAASHGNDVCLAVRHLGAARMPHLFAVKRRIDRLLRKFGSFPADRLLQAVGRVAPHPLPVSVRALTTREHMLIITVADDCVAETREHFAHHLHPSLTVHECSGSEGAALQRLRFATAGAMVRLASVERGAGPLVAIDCALPRNCTEWRLVLPSDLTNQVMLRADYGHFLCHVFHLDFILKPDCDAQAFEAALIDHLHGKGVMCPAEHNFGHHYRAPDNVVAFYRALDPTNALNPGIGHTSRAKNWL
jgi:D-lactate dehydrogenase